MKKAKNWPPTKKEQDEVLHMLRQLSPAGLIKVQKEVAALFVNMLSEFKTPEELIEVPDSMLTTPFPPPPVMAAEIKKRFHENLSRKKDHHSRQSRAGAGRRE